MYKLEVMVGRRSYGYVLFALCTTSFFFFSSAYALTLRDSPLVLAERVRIKAPLVYGDDYTGSKNKIFMSSSTTLQHMYLTRQQQSAHQQKRLSFAQSVNENTQSVYRYNDARQQQQQTLRDRGVLGFIVGENNEKAYKSARNDDYPARRTETSLSVSRVDTADPVPLYEFLEDRHASTPLPVTLYPWIPNQEQINKLTVAELKSACQERGLQRTGTKPVLQERLIRWIDQEEERQKNWLSDEAVKFWNTETAVKKEPTIVDDNVDFFAEKSTFSFEDDRKDVSQRKALVDTKSKTQDVKQNTYSAWADNTELQPLLKRRQDIHREKQVGKKINKYPAPTPDEYRKVLSNLFSQPTTNYSNLDVKVMYNVCKQADQQGDRSLAKRILCKLEEITPHDARIFRRLARMEQEEGNIPGAKFALQRGLKLHPDNAYLWQGLAQIATVNSEAKEYYHKAIAADPSQPHSYHALGTMEHTHGNIARAMKILKQGIEYCPTNHRLHHAMGDLYRDAKMLDMAEKSYRKALKFGNHISHGFAYNGLAYVAYDNRNFDACRTWLREGIALNNGRFANGWVALAQFEESIGNVEAARQVYVEGIQQYERGLLLRNKKRLMPHLQKLRETPGETPTSIRNELLKAVPSFRSGDRFYNVYRSWLRLEELHGTPDSVKAVYDRASLAFPTNYMLTLDCAEYYVKLGRVAQARTMFAKACSQAKTVSVEPFRKFGEFEISLGNFEQARAILYHGASLLVQTDNAVTKKQDFAKLFHTWAVCEWHLGELSRAETLFDHALRTLSKNNDDDSKLRSFILYSMAMLEFHRDELSLAQHYIGLCLQENVLPGGNSQVWDLWANVATEMGNARLLRQCQEQSRIAQEPLDLTLKSLNRLKMEQLMRRDPWHQKLFGNSSSSFKGVDFPALSDARLRKLEVTKIRLARM